MCLLYAYTPLTIIYLCSSNLRMFHIWNLWCPIYPLSTSFHSLMSKKAPSMIYLHHQLPTILWYFTYILNLFLLLSSIAKSPYILLSWTPPLSINWHHYFSTTPYNLLSYSQHLPTNIPYCQAFPHSVEHQPTKRYLQFHYALSGPSSPLTFTRNCDLSWTTEPCCNLLRGGPT